MKGLRILMITVATLFLVSCGDSVNEEDIQKADRLIQNAYKEKAYSKLLQLVDSLEPQNCLSHAKADYWRGYAFDKMNKLRMAEFHWKTSIESASQSESQEDIEAYTMSASRLANLLSVRGDYEGVLNMALPVVERLESLQCDSTADYVNLLIYIGCCQAALSDNSNAVVDGFERAYQKHLENIEKHRDDASYKNAIAGLINITYYCLASKNYKNALEWIKHFGDLLKDYQQRLDISTEYTDKQLARYFIYQAQALEGLGKHEEAAQAYKDFQTTDFSKTPEGHISANDYLVTAQRWNEAASNYSSLDAMLGYHNGGYSLENIRELVLKKYLANIRAGRRDSAIAVSLQICDSLEQAFTQAKKIDAEEQAAIVKKVEQIGEQNAQSIRSKQITVLIIIAFIFVGIVMFMIYRRITLSRLKKAYWTLTNNSKHIADETAVKTRSETEQQIACTIHQSTVTSVSLPKHKDLKLQVAHTPGIIAGDGLYDLQVIGDKLFYCIGNSTQKGALASALCTAVLAQVRTTLTFLQDPARMMDAVNKAFSYHDGIAVKLQIGMLDIVSGQLQYCNAGYHAPILVGSEVSQLQLAESLPIGGQADYDYHLEEVTLEKGTKLLLYSDGIIEAENSSHKPYGDKKLRGSALQAVKMNAEIKPFLDNLLEAINAYTGNRPQASDQTLIVISR